MPFAAGNFAYIGGTDLLPELTTDPGAFNKAVGFAAFVTGVAILWATTLIT